MSICKLCNKQEATKTNSHIFPKFLGESMLIAEDGARKGYKISSIDGLSKRPKQDTPKEDFLLCLSCETLFDRKFESPFAKDFYNIRENPRNYFTVYIRNRHIYRVYYKCDFALFMNFFYSIIFRASISNHEHFSYYTLPQDIHEKIRKILLGEIPFECLPLYVFTCQENPYPSGNFIGAFTYRNDWHFFSANEFIFILDLSPDHFLGNHFPDIYKPDYMLVRVLTLPYNYWSSWIMDTAFGTIAKIMLENIQKRNMIEWIIKGLIIDKYLKSGMETIENIDLSNQPSS